MGQLSRENVETLLRGYRDPYLDSDLMSAKAVKDIAVEGSSVAVKVVLGFQGADHHAQLQKALEERLASIPDVTDVSVTVGCKIVSHAVQQGVDGFQNVKNIIAVASGKGGVGKSTVAVNLALALAADGARVGLLDADIYGPSQPRMLGARERPDSKDGRSLEPVVRYQIQSMSIGYLVDEETPMIWRGPMVTQALEQLLKDTNWTDLDYLVVDLPPGTGDTQLTLAQKIPVSGAVVVTTPQDIALLDARKGFKMFDKVRVPVLGIVENMSVYICPQCAHEDHIFGEGGGKRMAQQYGVRFLGALPLDTSVRADTDGGTPSVIKDPDSRVATLFRDLARRTAAQLSLQRKDFAKTFPKIQIQS